MSVSDYYNTIDRPSKGIFKDKGSKFIALAHPVSSVSDVKNIIDSLKKEYHSARHHCYAYLLNNAEDDDQWRANDDGEPSGTAGKPILGQIYSHEVTDILIVVVRYFGGTLLGVSGLINAYRSAAADALANATIIEKYITYSYNVYFPYLAMNDVMTVIKDEGLAQTNQSFDSNCLVTLSLPASSAERITERLEKIAGVKVEQEQ